MKMKKVWALLLCLVLCFTVTACRSNISDISDSGSSFSDTVAEIDAKDNEKDGSDVSSSDESPSAIAPLLYKVSDNNGNFIWLFGSIHAGEEYFYPLPDYVTEAFNSSDCLAVEFDIVAFEKDMSAQIKALQALVYTDGTTIRDHISSETYDKAVKILEEHDIYNESLDYFPPSLWSSFIDNATHEKIGINYDLGIDVHMINLAYEQEKKVLNVESAKLQYGMLADFSAELQELLLETSIEEYDSDELSESFDMLLQTWAGGDEEELDQLINEEPELDTDEEKSLYEEYNKAMIVDRNSGMTKYAEQALLSGDEVFICVGAAHVVGEGAIAQQLANLGYKVEIVRD